MRCRTLDVSSCWTYTSSQAFRFGTGGDMVDTHIHKHTDTTHHSSALHRSSLPASQRANIPSLPPKDLARLLYRTLLLWACSLTRIRNQRPAGVVRH